MPKSEKIPDLSISREVSHRIRSSLIDMLNSYIDECRDFGLDESEYFSALYQRDMFLSKYMDEDTLPADERRLSAIRKWLGVEVRNQHTNHRLFWSDPSFVTERGRISGQAFLRKVRRLITKVIGVTPPDDILSKGSFSGGATSSLKRGPGVLAKKFTGSRDVTLQCWEVLSRHLSDIETWKLSNPELLQPRFVKGNVLFTVPKTPVIDRVACKEPDYNIFAQKAVGDFFRDRLQRKAGINLNDQSINRDLACEGSITGAYATIDLSSASDSLTTGLVSSVLPYHWFKLLDALRSPKTFIDGASHTNEMFSSMGNGFTFELESLIFWAVAQTVRDQWTRREDLPTRDKWRVSVYGDDIIVPTRTARMTITALNWCGFKVNVDKTFISGRFRESCGGHYYGGNDVSPFFLRRPIKDVSDLILFLNQFRAWLIRTEMDSIDNGWTYKNRFVRFWYHLAAFVPNSLWGGFDLESRTQLVSPGKQRCELLKVTRRDARLETQLQVGLYLTRLVELDRRVWDRPPLDIDGSILMVPTSKYVIRRCKVEPYVFGLVRPLFLIEQLTD